MRTLSLITAVFLSTQSLAPVRTDTMHLTLNTSISSTEIAPGQKLSLSFDITPKRAMHVYAPG